MAETYYSPEEVAQKLNLKSSGVRKWIREGKLQAVKLGRLWRIPDKELQRFIEAGRTPGGQGEIQKASS